MQIIRAYKTTYDSDLLAVLQSETKGNFRNILVALLTHTSDYCAQEIHDALYGKKINENTLIEIMSTKSCYDICEISVAFERKFNQSLEESLREKTSGGLKNFLLSLYSANRDNSIVENVVKAKECAMDLKAAAVDKVDEKVFLRILCHNTGKQVTRITAEYENLTGRTLKIDIKREFSGTMEKAFLSVLRVAKNPAKFFAQCLYKSMKGLGTDNKSLIRLVVGRCEIDMENIKIEFQNKYGKSLKSFINWDTSGHYKKALLYLIGEK